MSWAKVKDICRRFCVCFDSISFLDWVHRNNLQTLFFLVLRYRVSPLVLEDVSEHDAELDELGRLYALGISSLKVGNTFKTTGVDRTSIADAMLDRLAKGSPSLMEVGVSDGSSALGHFSVPERYSRIVLTDRFTRFYIRNIPLGKMFLDSEKRLFGIKFLCFFIYLTPRPVSDDSGYVPMEVVNPILRKRYSVNKIIPFDMFKDALDDPVDIIKCSNILNVCYFPDAELLAALRNLCRSLADRGHLVVSQNNESYEGGEAALLLEKDGHGLRVIKSINSHDLLKLFVGPEQRIEFHG